MYYHFLRPVRTTQERRANGTRSRGADYDDFRVRSRARRGLKRLPNYWDDIQVDRSDRSWKVFRKTQYKAVSMDLTNCDPAKARVVELPYAFGDIVYFKASEDKTPGIVVGFIFVSTGVKVLVTWGDNRRQDEHYLIELSREHEIIF